MKMILLTATIAGSTVAGSASANWSCEDYGIGYGSNPTEATESAILSAKTKAMLCAVESCREGQWKTKTNIWQYQ